MVVCSSKNYSDIGGASAPCWLVVAPHTAKAGQTPFTSTPVGDGITDTASLDFRVPGSMYVQASMLCASALYTTPDKTGNPVGTIYLIRNLSPSST